MMIRVLSRLGMVILGLLLLTAVPASPASAADAAGCRIAPGYTFTFSPNCVNDKPASSYSVAFHAPAGSNYAWSITGDWVGVVGGCGSADAYCTVSTRGSNIDREVQAQVTVGGVVTDYYYAYIRAYCYEAGLGYYLC